MVARNHSNLLIIQAGRPPDDIRSALGEQPDWFEAALSSYGEKATVVRPFLGEELPDPINFKGSIITGSWSMVTDREDWSERTATWIRNSITTEHPMLGVCYGHQLMAHALGGKVDFHPNGKELGIKTITLSQDAEKDPLLAGLPAQFSAFLSHAQSVLEPPAQIVSLGQSDHDTNQILRYGPKAFSIQFHPEFTTQIMTACIKKGTKQKDFDITTELLQLMPTPYSLRILHSFVEQLS